MAGSDTDFARYAGQVTFPRSPQDLTNTDICPACLNPLTSTVCGVCHLDLNHPAAAELFQLSTDAAAALVRRLTLIGRIRYETAQLLEQQAATRAETLAQAALISVIAPPAELASSAGPMPAPAPFVGLVPTSAHLSVPVGSPALAGQPPTPRRSSVQVILLIVGVSLLSIAAIFFLVFAFITYGLLARSIIIGSLTLAALVAASLLKRRGLRATAEGIAVFAVVLVYLDAFAVRANNLAGLEDANGAIYWGIILSCSAIAFMLWHRASTLRVPNIVAFAAVVPGVGLLVGGLADSLPSSTQYFAAFVAAAAAGLVHLLAPSRTSGSAAAGIAERIIALSMAGVGLAGAFFAAFAVQPGSVWAPAVALAIVGIVALTHVLVIGSTTVIGSTDAAAGVRILGTIIAGTGAVAVAAIGATIATRLDTADFTTADFTTAEPALFWPVVIAVTAALGLEAVARRTTNPAMALPGRVAAFSAAAVAALAGVIPLSIALFWTFAAAVSGYADPWARPATATATDRGAGLVSAIAALAVVILLVAGFWAASGLFRKRSAILFWAAAAVLVLAVPLSGVVWATVTGWLLFAAIGTVLLVITRERTPILPSLRLPIAAGSIMAMILGYSASWVSIDTWGWASLATIAILLAGRSALRREQAIPRSVLLAAAIVTALVGAAALARQLAGAYTTEWTSGIDALRFVGILATLLVAGAATVPARFAARFASTIDRRVAYWVALPVALVVSLGSKGVVDTAGRWALDTLLLPEFGTSLVLGLGLFCALLLWVIPRATATGTGALRPERIVASIAVAPTVYWVVDSFVRVLGLPEYARMTAPIVATLLVAVGSLSITLLRSTVLDSTIPVPSTPSSSTVQVSSLPRWVRETSIALVAVPAVLFAVATDQDAAWLVLLLAGITALILAISADGLFASASRRKHFGWLAILLATAGLWWRLAGDQVSALEPYVLPVSGVLLLVAYLIWRAADRAARAMQSPERSPAPSSAAPLVALGGLLVAILPLSVDATTGDVVRAFVIGAISALLLLGGVFIATGSALRPYLDAAAFTGTIGVLITGAGRGVFLVLESGGSDDARLDAWLGGTFLVLMLAAVGIPWANDAADGSRSRRRIAAQALVVLAMTSVLVLEGASLGSDSLGPIRAFAVTVLFSLVYLASIGWRRSPFTPMVGWIGLGFAAVTALIGMAVGALDPIEFGTLPIAIALIIGGTIHLARNPHARSWPHLGPGILVLLVPSLIATAIATPAITPAITGGEDRPLWRLVGLGVLAVTMLVVGVVRRLQAPFILGVLVALIHGIATFSREIRVVYEAVPWWLWLGFGGVLLIVLAARYEKRIKNLKDAALTVGALR
jgi:hypothetical protein